MGKIVIVSVFGKVDGLLRYDTQIEVEEDELFNVRVVDGDDLQVFSNDGEVEFEGDIQGFTETKVRGFQPKEPTEKPKKKTKKTKKEGE